MGLEPEDLGDEGSASLDAWHSVNMDINEDSGILRPRASSAVETTR